MNKRKATEAARSRATKVIVREGPCLAYNQNFAAQSIFVLFRCHGDSVRETERRAELSQKQRDFLLILQASQAKRFLCEVILSFSWQLLPESSTTGVLQKMALSKNRCVYE